MLLIYSKIHRFYPRQQLPEQRNGSTGCAIEWIRSCLSDRIQLVTIPGGASNYTNLAFSTPLPGFCSDFSDLFISILLRTRERRWSDVSEPVVAGRTSVDPSSLVVRQWTRRRWSDVSGPVVAGRTSVDPSSLVVRQWTRRRWSYVSGPVVAGRTSVDPSSLVGRQ